MSEFRQDIATGEWIIIATERGKRPEDFVDHTTPKNLLPEHDEDCPFCPGGEAASISSSYQVERPDGWSLRVLPNKYAVLDRNSTPQRRSSGIHLFANGYGTADVIIESPKHNSSPVSMEPGEFEEVIKAYRVRYNQILEDKYINIINIFRNYGQQAGASLAHPHSQIIGSLVCSPQISEKIYYARRAFNTWGKCIYCDLISAELKQKERMVCQTEHFIAYCPFASKFPFEISIIPRRHFSVFGNIRPEEEKDLANILQNVLQRLYCLLGDPDYNYIINSISTNDGEVQFYHWSLNIMPRITKLAGFEFGAEIYINITAPEDCAKLLRETDLSKLNKI
ncbi:MAG: galactose-1-phosphate uridylyltransferase [Deltaproteobacteria bacterium]|nr:galactose-1-phosphate uridylyltransferase [Deltaproteobacteria bacterium]